MERDTIPFARMMKREQASEIEADKIRIQGIEHLGSNETLKQYMSVGGLNLSQKSQNRKNL